MRREVHTDADTSFRWLNWNDELVFESLTNDNVMESSKVGDEVAFPYPGAKGGRSAEMEETHPTNR